MRCLLGFFRFATDSEIPESVHRAFVKRLQGIPKTRNQFSEVPEKSKAMDRTILGGKREKS